MAGLDNLVNKIADEAKLEADEIVLQAENKAKALREEAKLLLDKEAERLEAKNELQRNLIKEQLKSGAELRARNNRLATKQAVIAQIFQEVYSELVDMSDEEYLNYINSHISKDGTSVIVMKNKFDLCNARLENVNVVKDKFVDSGFIEVMEEFENNYTFDSKINMLKDELEGQLAKLLFE